MSLHEEAANVLSRFDEFLSRASHLFSKREQLEDSTIRAPDIKDTAAVMVLTKALMSQHDDRVENLIQSLEQMMTLEDDDTRCRMVPLLVVMLRTDFAITGLGLFVDVHWKQLQPADPTVYAGDNWQLVYEFLCYASSILSLAKQY